MAAVVVLPRQFQVLVVENVDERHVTKAIWLFPLYLLLINMFVLPIAFAGLLHFPERRGRCRHLRADRADGRAVPGDRAVRLHRRAVGGDRHDHRRDDRARDHGLQRSRHAAAAAPRPAASVRAPGPDRRCCSRSAAAPSSSCMLLGYAYVRLIGESYALVTIGLVSFVAAMQFVPAIVGGVLWKGATRLGALAGLSARLRGLDLHAAAAVVRALGLDVGDASSTDGPVRHRAARSPTRCSGLTASIRSRTRRSGRWSSMSGCYVGVSLVTTQIDHRAQPGQCSSSTSSSDAQRGDAHLARPRHHRRPAAPAAALHRRGARRCRVRALRARHTTAASTTPSPADADIVAYVERQLAGAIGAASARIMVASVLREEMHDIDEVMQILDEASQLVVYSRQLEEKSQSSRRRPTSFAPPTSGSRSSTS